ncbi:MAG: hypothetical protein IJ593_04770 [Lachnospiraceae bacterium]|nr:hypothetical protein [Lachnospiraceae bacterium]
MDEMTDLLRGILAELRDINRKLDDIKGTGFCDSIADVCTKLDRLNSTIMCK